MALRVTQVRSAIGSKPKQRGTLRALGLGRIGKANTLPDRPEIRGMIHRVPHLVEVDEVAEPVEMSQAAEPGAASSMDEAVETGQAVAPDEAAATDEVHR